MAAKSVLRVVVGGCSRRSPAVEADICALDGFEVVALDGELEPDVVVLVHDPLADPGAQLAAVREHWWVPVVFATTSPSDELVRWALGSGIADVVTLPAAPGALLFALEKAARAETDQAPSGGARVVTVFSPKGGSGKSVVATNVAAAAAAKGRRRTLLVDLDLQFGDAAIMLGLHPQATVRELIGTSTELDAEKLEVYTELHPCGLRVLPAPLNPEDAELVGEDAVRRLLEVARSAYDLVVVDTAPFFYGPMLATLDHTDRLLVLCTPDVPTLKNVRLALKTLDLLSFPEDRVSIVLNRASAAMGLEHGDVEAALERKVDFVLPLDPAVPLAVNQAVPAVLGKASRAFAPAALELASSAARFNLNPARQPSRPARIFTLGRS
ncbi:MAG TPA: AAA family ATPase [Gaiellaceae bacterium]|nr:AAA family ATPase [Gaiellaceae bacterium]